MGILSPMLELPPLQWLQILDLQTLLIFLAVVLGLKAMRTMWRDRGLPPGPPMWSLAGNLLFCAKRPHVALMELSKKYGNIMTCYTFCTPMVVLSGFQVTQEALVQHGREFADRPHIPLVTDMRKGQGIILAHYGMSWKQQRRFTLTVLRNFGLGKISFEQKILEEVQYLTEVFMGLKDQPFNPNSKITSAVSNVIYTVVLGKRFHYEDRRFTELMELFDENLKLQTTIWAQLTERRMMMEIKIILQVTVSAPARKSDTMAQLLYSLVPFIHHLPGPHQKIFENKATIEARLEDFIKQHRETLNGETIRDFIDAYLLEMEKEQNSPNSCLTEGNLLHNVFDLFIAGTETTTNTLQWGLLIMMAYSDIQEKCQQEIEKVIGWSRAPSMEDVPSMPYVSAVIHEIQRFGNIVPLSVSHATLQDTTLRGYLLKKNTFVIINLASVLSDETQWKYPKEFNPENFLNEKGEFFKPEAFVPFSMGLRACPGEKLARMELFLFFTSLIRAFEFYWPDSCSSPSLQSEYQLTLRPQPYKLGVRCRKAPVDGAAIPSDG